MNGLILSETEQPCGCVVITDDSPVIINGADMAGIVANISDIRRCATHKAEWDAGIQRMAARIDREIAEKVYGDLYPQASAQVDGAGVMSIGTEHKERLA